MKNKTKKQLSEEIIKNKAKIEKLLEWIVTLREIKNFGEEVNIKMRSVDFYLCNEFTNELMDELSNKWTQYLTARERHCYQDEKEEKLKIV